MCSFLGHLLKGDDPLAKQQSRRPLRPALRLALSLAWASHDDRMTREPAFAPAPFDPDAAK
jgi:hypothetical protein